MSLFLKTEKRKNSGLGVKVRSRKAFSSIVILPDDLGGTTVQLSIGGDYRFKRTLLRLAIVEDIAGDATPDFALHLSIRSFGG